MIGTAANYGPVDWAINPQSTVQNPHWASQQEQKTPSNFNCTQMAASDWGNSSRQSATTRRGDTAVDRGRGRIQLPTASSLNLWRTPFVVVSLTAQ
ncbi:hypothetical protein ACLKA7_003889 [Drosophila subpalustris]